MKTGDDPHHDPEGMYAETHQPRDFAVKPSISSERTQLLVAAIVLVVTAVLLIEWQW
ncbi:hypothetical protein SK066_18050 [Paenibacillus hunanensis]|uniref:hypothetical protein n=1 Tax=Paenibacillus hunanensis TaxID=539262 RepID=UPI002025E10D|nr:hypothetical protein [Paenibacillus hunanensis]MCL9659445.1 hypothetical protein [Paenibacillus hunanensis]WPP40483.1 hypothetical protein SK066_18050 [Paenibacillus hunanensis]